MKQILILSYGDACRSRIAKELLASFGRGMEITTAGISDGYTIPVFLTEVMEENGYEISRKRPCMVHQLPVQHWDYVLTLCQDVEHEFDSLNLDYKGVTHLDFPEGGNTKETLTTLYEDMYRTLFRFYRNILSDLLMPTCTCGANTYCRCE